MIKRYSGYGLGIDPETVWCNSDDVDKLEEKYQVLFTFAEEKSGLMQRKYAARVERIEQLEECIKKVIHELEDDATIGYHDWAIEELNKVIE